MQTITTKYHHATNTKGARISCTSTSRIRKYYAFPMEGSFEDAHAKCAKAFRDHMGWKGGMVGGMARDDAGYVFCFKDSWIAFD